MGHAHGAMRRNSHAIKTTHGFQRSNVPCVGTRRCDSWPCACPWLQAPAGAQSPAARGRISQPGRQTPGRQVPGLCVGRRLRRRRQLRVAVKWHDVSFMSVTTSISIRISIEIDRGNKQSGMAAFSVVASCVFLPVVLLYIWRNRCS